MARFETMLDDGVYESYECQPCARLRRHSRGLYVEYIFSISTTGEDVILRLKPRRR